MMDTKLIDLLPENISNEAAYHLVNFMMELALALESHYFIQLMRYHDHEDNQGSI
jgi:hypothetical protein